MDLGGLHNLTLSENDKLILFELDPSGKIATLYLNRPEKMNALNWNMFMEISDVVDKISQERGIRLVIIRAKGKHFSSGIDVKLLAGQDPTAPPINFGPAPFRHIMRNQFQPVITKLATLEKPTIAVIDGLCLGSGFELALACDFRYATERSIFQMKEAQLGIIPDLGGTSRLLPLINTSQAKEICLVARKVSATDGYRMGFLNGVAENAINVEKMVQELVKDILTAAPLAYGLGKRVIDKITSQSIAEGLDETAMANSILFNSKDFRRGLAAWMEKKQPNWKGN